MPLDEPSFSNVRSLPKAILFAGGAGFLGSALCIRLPAGGNRVICADNLQTGNLANLATVAGHPGFRFLRHDLIAPLRIDGPLDDICNMA